MKQKLFKTNASVWFKKQCKALQLTPKYAQIHIEDNNSRNIKKRWLLNSELTLRRLMSYIYGAPILDVSRSHTTTQHSR